RLAAWPDGLGALAASPPPADLLGLEARCDSAFLWALLRRRLADGEPAASAVAATVAETAKHSEGRFNVLLTDGRTIVATAYGDTLFHRTTSHGVVVASEPDADGVWTEVPDRTVVTATRDGVHLHPLTDRS
ncbi:MAG: class II glutamine amidotransferase, partial [Streptomycetaceae bacterium]|nr:class II glutamine amidotransferase [Streptomycetaceae bacterium]